MLSEFSVWLAVRWDKVRLATVMPLLLMALAFLVRSLIP